MTKRGLILLGIVLLAASFRLPRIGHDSFWQDEVLTGQSATAPFLEVVSDVRQMENAPPLYFLLMNCWAKVFGSTDVALRVPSALAGVAAVAVIAVLAWRLFPGIGDRAGLWAAAMLAVQPYHIAYSMEARPYALAFLLALWSCQALVVSLQSASRGAPILYVILSAAMIWTHTFCGLVWVAQNLVVVPLLWTRPSPAMPLRRWIVLQGAVLVLLAPWVHASMDVYRIGAPWIPHTSLLRILEADSGSTSLLMLWIALALFATIFGNRQDRFAILLALCVFIVPIVIPLAISALDRPMFVPRYSIAALIGVHLLCGYAAARIGAWRTWLGAATGGAVVLAGLCTSVPLFLSGTTLLHHDDVRSAAAKIDELARPGDAVYCSTVHYWPAFDRYCRSQDLQRIRELPQLDDLPREPGTVWLILEDKASDIAVNGYSAVSRWTSQGLRLVRADRTSPPKVE
jgi:uncharacterized membrane protein